MAPDSIPEMRTMFEFRESGLFFYTWEDGFPLPAGTQDYCPVEKLHSVFPVGWFQYDRRYLPLVLRKAVYQVGPLMVRYCHQICHSEYLPDSKPSAAIGFFIGRGRGSIKFLLMLSSSLVPSATVALGCSWLQVSTGEMRALQPPPRTFEGKALVTQEGRAPRCLLTYPHTQPFSDSTPSDSLPMIRVDWTWDSEPCYSTCAKRCCFAVGWRHREGN